MNLPTHTTWIAPTADLRSCPGSPNFMWVQGLFGPVRPACTMGTAFGGHFLGKNVLTIRLLEKAFCSAIAPNLICRICRNLWSSKCSLLVPRFEQQPTLDCEVERSERRECVEEGLSPKDGHVVMFILPNFATSLTSHVTHTHTITDAFCWSWGEK